MESSIHFTQNSNQQNKTLPAGTLRERSTIPFIVGINAHYDSVKKEQDSILYGVGSRVDRFTIVKRLCRGAQSTLFLAEDRRQSRVVIKIYDIGVAGNTAHLRKLSDLIRNRGCSYLMPIIRYGDLEQGVHYEVMPVYQQGTLENAHITEDEMIHIVLPQLNEALRFLHENHLIHNDVKPANIFWKDRTRKEVVLGDYDCLTSDQDEKAGGTPLYMAPERIFTDGERHTAASDYCSLGLTLITLLNGKSLFDEEEVLDAQTDEALQKYLYRRWQRHVSCPLSMELSAKSRALLNNLLQAKPEDRHNGEYISRWINNDGIGYRTFHQKKERTVIKGLKYRGKLILDIFELIQVLGNDWEYGKFMLEQHQLDDFVRQFDGKYYQFSQIYSAEHDKSAGLFKLMQTLAPSISFYWEGKHYDSLEQFVNQTEEQGKYGLRDSFCHFCRERLISFYEIANGGTQEQVKRASEIEEIGRLTPELAVKKLQISLQKRPDLIWHGTTILSLEDLLTYLEKCGDRLDDEVAEIYASKAFQVWLDFIQHGSMLSLVEKQLMESGI